eukprot:scaffold42917_cov62-Phaeocystis_antarctica.AAC.1
MLRGWANSLEFGQRAIDFQRLSDGRATLWADTTAGEVEARQRAVGMQRLGDYLRTLDPDHVIALEVEAR